MVRDSETEMSCSAGVFDEGEGAEMCRASYPRQLATRLCLNEGSLSQVE